MAVRIVTKLQDPRGPLRSVTRPIPTRGSLVPKVRTHNKVSILKGGTRKVSILKALKGSTRKVSILKALKDSTRKVSIPRALVMAARHKRNGRRSSCPVRACA